MKHKLISFLFLFGLSVGAYAQRTIPDNLAQLFRNQLTTFPQEKIYVHTDKSFYISGDPIWFRAYLADAVSHIPSPVSCYVYVELINPLNAVINRVIIRPDETDAYHGYIAIPRNTPQGEYTLRAYTTFMRNLDEDYFFTKRIYIGYPQSGSTKAENYIQTSVPDNDFDVSFYPEGGSLHKQQGRDKAV